MQSILLRLVVAPTHFHVERVSSTDLGNLPASTHGYILIRLLLPTRMIHPEAV